MKKRYEPDILSRLADMDQCEDGQCVRYEDFKAVVEALKMYLKSGLGNSTDFMIQSEAYHMARAALKQINGE